MSEFKVTVRGPNGYLERGRYMTRQRDAESASEVIYNRLKDDGYIRLWNTGDFYTACTVVFKEAVISFSVEPITKEE